jgi:serine/threonine protein kinase
LHAGFVDDNAVQELLSECARMKNFSNLHVMSLKGVCLDGGPVPYIVLPYMANGSLATYLKKERKNLVMKDDENEPQSQDLVSLQSYNIFYYNILFRPTTPNENSNC